MKLRTKILLIALLPVFLLGIGIFILAADRTANGIYDQAYAGMEAAALAVRDIFEAGNDGPYQTDENGDLWKGTGLNISNAFEIVDHIKDNTGMDVTIFWGDTRILTSIKDRTGERQIHSSALRTPRANVSAIINEIRLQMLIVIAVVLFVTTLFLIRVINGMINGLASGMKVLQSSYLYFIIFLLTYIDDRCIIYLYIDHLYMKKGEQYDN